MTTLAEINAYLEVIERENKNLWDWNYVEPKQYWKVEYKGVIPICKLNLELDSQCLYIHILIGEFRVRSECRMAMFYFLLRLNDELPIVKFGFDSEGRISLMAETGVDQVSLSAFKALIEAAVAVFGQYCQEIELLARECDLADLLLAQDVAVNPPTVKVQILNKSINPNNREGG